MEHLLNDMDCEGVMPPIFRGINLIRTKDIFMYDQMDREDEMKNHICTSDCRRIGCEEVENNLNRVNLALN